MGKPSDLGQPRRHRKRRPRRTVHEYSAGGLVIDGFDCAVPVAALIGKTDRRGRTRWTLPKGHIEISETAEQTAIREIAEETGIRGEVMAPLGSIDYWFCAQEYVVHKTVHHYLVRFVDGELSADDHEVAEVAWVPLADLRSRLAYADERKLSGVAARLIAEVRTHGAAALGPLSEGSQ